MSEFKYESFYPASEDDGEEFEYESFSPLLTDEEEVSDFKYDSFGPLNEEISTKAAIESLPDAETINDLMTDSNFAVVGQYMDQRFGMRESDHNRKKIVDSFVNHMRKFNFGQSITTVTELAYLNSTEDKAKKIGAGQAYNLFDNMKGAFSEEYTFGQKADAVGDYARALVIDPVNLVSLGFGKLITGGATKVAAQLAKETVKTLVAKELGKKTIKGVLSPAQQVKANIIEQRVIGQIIKGQPIKGISGKKGSAVAKDAFSKSMKGVARKEIALTAAFDSAAAVSVDAVYQRARMNALVSEGKSVQDNYSVAQSALTGISGVFGGSLAYGFNLLNKSPHSQATLPLFIEAHDNAISLQAAAETLAKKERKKSNKAAIKAMDFTALTKALKKSSTNAKRWADKVDMGDTLIRMSDEAAADPRRDDLLAAFFHGIDDDNAKFKGLKGIFEDFNIKLSNEDDKFQNFTDFLTETIDALPKQAKSEVEALYNVTMKKLPEFSKLKLKGGMYALSSMAAKWGRDGQILSSLKRDLKLSPDGMSAVERLNVMVEEVTDAPTKSTADAFRAGVKEKGMGLQQNLIRMLITHPGTTALNVVGWGNASAMTSVGDMIRGALYGGRALGELAIGRNTKASEFATKSKLMYSLQRQKFTNLVSPYATKQAAFSYLSANPKAQKELFRYMSGGIELDDVYKNLGFDMSDVNKPGGFEKVMDFAQTMYGVKAQDMFTKSQEFMYAIDKQIRINYGMSYSEFIQDPNLFKNLKGDEYAALQATAVEDALRSVYAKSFGGDRTKAAKGFEYFARPIEDIRKVPVFGAMVPFGQFFNNTLGHFLDHTGISFVHKYAAGTTRDPLELAIKGAVGLSFIGVTAAREYKNMEEGLALFDERGSDGSIKNRMYDFPYSYYKAMGRVGAHMVRDGGAPPEMWREIVTVFGPKNLTRQLGDSAKMSYDLFADIITGDMDEPIRDQLIKVVQDTGSMYISGLSRPFDPVNQIIGLSRGEDYLPPDRKQGSEFVNKSTRYVDQIFSALLPEQKEKFNALTDQRTLSPIGRITGYREVSGQTSIQRMYNEIGRPQWRTNIKSFLPEVRNDINKYIFGFLETNAEKTVNSYEWKNGSIEERKAMLSNVLERSRDTTMDILENSIDPNDRKTLKLYNISKGGKGTTKSDVTKAMKKLNLDMEIKDLDDNQLDFLILYLDAVKDDLSSVVSGSNR